MDMLIPVICVHKDERSELFSLIGTFDTVGTSELQDAGKAGLVTIQGKISAVLGTVLICKSALLLNLIDGTVYCIINIVVVIIMEIQTQELEESHLAVSGRTK